MRITSAPHWTLLVALLASAGCMSPESATDVQEADDSPPPTPITTKESEQVGQYVMEIYQDRDGDLWFTTIPKGVCRYDGESLTYLEEVRPREIVQDEDGAMWFISNPAVRRYENGTFTDYTTAEGLSDNWCGA